MQRNVLQFASFFDLLTLSNVIGKGCNKIFICPDRVLGLLLAMIIVLKSVLMYSIYCMYLISTFQKVYF